MPLLEYMREMYPKTELLAYPDHHIFTDKDIAHILEKAKAFKCVVTTEKDYMRLQHTSLVRELADKLYVQTIETDFGSDKEAFDRAVMLYVSENNRHHNE